ncbi:hypothetical protein LZ838_11530 [Pseudomonas sp. AA27]|uniref:hypothetical protein n=1 Tax=Pseudomonas sp. AA27 TaxID=2908652 RepID=UPI001F465509|nr:hypothetical protein [Pseudomonas sp. AA27]MCF1487986.1 hypothetical protein [Pseudomonas sp. AA27]
MPTRAFPKAYQNNLQISLFEFKFHESLTRRQKTARVAVFCAREVSKAGRQLLAALG